ncbi:helix-turn-helix domain-containing protein [Marinobacterium sedimentorum]|uniref:helix-turn-helix domain-containing protein n=1 Tax=Marinobacterium sedimentorum TaxID=2927804 RepID=UPI0020C7432D|nr:helix-turn-helix transcriptional regulator [Marinobacterium sedimentorum]MCP8687731.1 helix-turn-helix domain-containing protein [Marinobacterium sedimentorum]
MGSIGDRLKEERDRLGKNQEEFGTLGGVARNAQGRYEKDQRSPDALYLELISAAGADVQYIITGTRSGASAKAMSTEEVSLLEYYRGCTSGGRQHLLAAGKAFADLGKVHPDGDDSDGILGVRKISKG